MNQNKDYLENLFFLILLSLKDEIGMGFPKFQNETFEFFIDLYPNKYKKRAALSIWNDLIKDRGNLLDLYNAFLFYALRIRRARSAGGAIKWVSARVFVETHKEYISYDDQMDYDIHWLIERIQRAL